MIHQSLQILSKLNKFERLIFLGAAVIFFASVVIFGWRFYINNTVINPAKGGVYIEGAIGQPALINPVNAVGELDQDLVHLLFANLLQLTDSYKISPDNKIWTITLKKDLLWSDGQKITADDVVFTINTIQDLNTHSPLFSDWKDIIAERLNENEVRLILKYSYSFFLDNLKEIRPIPKHIFSDIPITNFRLSNYNLEPVGSGPYKFTNFSKEKNGFITEYQLSANNNFIGQKPYLEDFNLKFFNNVDDLINAFNNNEVTATGSLDSEGIKNIKRDYQKFPINIPRYYALFFNLSNDQSPLTKNLEARHALAMAVDKNQIINSALNNNAMAIKGPIFPGLEGYDENIYSEKFDPNEAKKILENEKLSKLDLDLIVPKIPFLMSAADIIKKNWEDLGVKLNINVVDPADIVNQFVKTRNYSAIIFGNILKANSDVYSFWHSSERFYPGLNLSLFNNKEVDSLLEVIRAENNASARQQYLIKLQKIINDQKPAIFLFSPNYLYITNKSLLGFKTDFIESASNRFDNVSNWYLKTHRKWK